MSDNICNQCNNPYDEELHEWATSKLCQNCAKDEAEFQLNLLWYAHSMKLARSLNISIDDAVSIDKIKIHAETVCKDFLKMLETSLLPIKATTEEQGDE